MALVSLYVPEGVPREFLIASELVHLVPTLTEPYALFDRTDTCACNTRDSLALRGRSVIVAREKVYGFPLYALPADCTLEETRTVLVWLFRHRFKTFKTRLVFGSLVRSLDSGCYFHIATTGCCEIMTLNTDPVFMLKSFVLSPYGKGPTLQPSS